MTTEDARANSAEAEPARQGRRARLREGIRANSSLNLGYRIGVGVVGALVLVAGLAMVPYPGPGWLVVFAGLGILSTEFEWAHKLLHRVRVRYDAFMEWFMRQPIWVKALAGLFATAATFLSLWLLGALALAGGWVGIDWPWLKSPFA